MNEEDLIKKITERKGNPFLVPEGYFDDFTVQLMGKLQKQQKKGRLAVRIWKYAAILLLAIGIGLTFFLYSSKKTDLTEETALQETYQEDYINDALDYAMIDNDEIELYLTEAQ